MQQFMCTVQCGAVFHVRPAGQLANMAKSYVDTVITITKNDKTVKASQLVRLMSLSLTNGDDILVTAEGPDETEAIETIRNFFRGSLS